jgi:putative tryptophan/tyrosine transport system substrate-binding protein
MRRFGISGLGIVGALSLLLGPQAAFAQGGSRTPLIGLLHAGDESPSAITSGFRQGLKDLGYSEGNNVHIEPRWARGRLDRLDDLAADLVRLKVDVLVAAVTQPSLAAKAATRTIPVVMIGVADPVGVGLITSLARPEGNITGTSTQQANMVAKQVELLKEADPGIVRLGVLWNPTNTAFQKLQLDEAQAAARASGIALTLFEASTPDDFEPVFASMREGSARALLILADPFFALRRGHLAQLAARDRLLTACGSRDFSEAGCLISYGPSYFEAGRRAASYVHKILRGARPSDLPVEQPTTFHLIINANTAKALGISIPPTLLARADEVIE